MKRSELFASVWSEPVVKVAQRFGISDRGLAKICTKHNIPLPQRGYWARLRSGQHPPALALPQPDNDYEIDILAPGDSAAAPTLNLQDAMDILFHRKPRPAQDAAEVVAEAMQAAQSPNVPAAAVPSIRDPSDQTAWRSALDAECERAMAAGMEYQRRQAAQAFLAAVVNNAYTLEEPAAKHVLDWARAVHKKLSQVDPVGAFIRELCS